MLDKILGNIILVIAYVGINCLLLLAIVLAIYLMIAVNKEMIATLGGLLK